MLEIRHAALEAQVCLFPAVLFVAVFGLDQWILVVAEIVVRALVPITVDGVSSGLVQAKTANISVVGASRRGVSWRCPVGEAAWRTRVDGGRGAWGWRWRQ